MNHFKTWKEAHTFAQERANETGLDNAIRKASRYDKLGFVVSLASRNDSDYALAEIVTPETVLCASCGKHHLGRIPCWLNEHHLRHPECRCQWCHAIGVPTR